MRKRAPVLASPLERDEAPASAVPWGRANSSFAWVLLLIVPLVQHVETPAEKDSGRDDVGFQDAQRCRLSVVGCRGNKPATPPALSNP